MMLQEKFKCLLFFQICKFEQVEITFIEYLIDSISKMLRFLLLFFVLKLAICSKGRVVCKEHSEKRTL
jgi:hypothetical protein